MKPHIVVPWPIELGDHDHKPVEGDCDTPPIYSQLSQELGDPLKERREPK